MRHSPRLILSHTVFIFLGVFYWSCVPRPKPIQRTYGGAKTFIVSEKTDLGTRLALLNEDGDLIKYIGQTPNPSIDRSPRVSPDGKRVVFLTNRQLPDGKNYEMWLLDLATEKSWPLLKNKFIKSPQWGGESILYFLMQVDGVYNAFKAKLDDEALGKPEQMSFFEEPCVSFSRSENGELACGVNYVDGGSLIWASKCDSCPWSQLTEGPNDRTPEWGNDGELYFSRRTEFGDYDVFVRAPSGEINNARRVALTDEFAPTLTEDGKICFMTSVLRSPKSGKTISNVVSFFKTNQRDGDVKVLFDKSVHKARYDVDFLSGGSHKKLFKKSPRLQEAFKTTVLEEMVRRQSEEQTKR